MHWLPWYWECNPLVTGQSNWCHVWGCNDNGHQIESEGLYLTQTLEFDKYTLKSITGDRSHEEVLARLTPVRHTTAFMMLHVILEESIPAIQATSNFDGPLNFVSGVAYYEEECRICCLGGLGFLKLFGFGTDFYEMWLKCKHQSKIVKAKQFTSMVAMMYQTS